MAEKSLNKVQIIGRLGGDPELRYTSSGQPVATFNVATDERWNDAQGQAQERTEWHRVVLWGKLGEVAGDYLRKGGRVYIEGRLQTNKWTDKNGNERETKEIIARDMILLGSKGESSGGARPPHPADTYAPQASPPSAAPTHTGKVSESPAMPPIQDMPPDDIPF